MGEFYVCELRVNKEHVFSESFHQVYYTWHIILNLLGFVHFLFIQ